MALTSGSKLGPYEILAPLGAGGMGEVSQTRPDRQVAKLRARAEVRRASLLAAMNPPKHAPGQRRTPTERFQGSRAGGTKAGVCSDGFSSAATGGGT